MMLVFLKFHLLILSVIYHQCSSSEQISSENSCEKWKRDGCSQYPLIYREFSRVLNGTSRKCWVQDLTKEYFNEVADMYLSQFIADEPLTKHSGCRFEQKCMDESKAEIWEFMREKASLVALTKDDGGNVVILGFNILDPILKNECKTEIQSDARLKIYAAYNYIMEKGRIFETFECDSFLSSIGLLVPREYRGQSIGYELMAARPKITKELGFDVSVVLFTGPASQKTAIKAGFKELIKVNYNDIGLEYAGIENDSEYAQLMYVLADE